MHNRTIRLSTSFLTRPLLLVVLLLIAINLAMQLYRIYTGQYATGLALMNLDGESNVPALFSTFLLLGAAAVLLAIAALERLHEGRDAGKWFLLAFGFTVMGFDENLALHERLIEPMRHLLGGGHLGIFYYAWLVPALVLVAALGLYFLPFLLRLPRRSMLAFVACAAIYLGGAVGVELIEGWWREDHTYRSIVYHLLVSLEEGMEMVGVIFFIQALLGYIAQRFGELRIGFEGVAVTAELQSSTPRPVTVGQPTPSAP
ncbi:hypothetical protein [Lysobacter terrae]